ncbi:MAG: ankyrin repeat domain-containing protein [Spirochaetes bacterium]|nr:ankyrin repeat domain-containing protein [Spirochaetota bacterium]
MSREFFSFCANNKLEEAKRLWEKGGIDLEFLYAGSTALLQAASKGYTEVAWWLVEIGVNLEAASSDGKTALIHAALRGHTDIVETLLNAKAEKNTTDKDGRTALHYAIMNGHENAAFRLTVGGAVSGIPDKTGNTALDEAIKRRVSGELIADLLGPAGLAIYRQNEMGETPLIRAIKDKQEENALYIISRMWDEYDTADKDGMTALHHAVRTGLRAVVAELVDAGADINCADKKGKTPLDYARQYHQNNKKLAEMLAQEQAPASEKTDAAFQLEKNHSPGETAVSPAGIKAAELIANAAKQLALTNTFPAPTDDSPADMPGETPVSEKLAAEFQLGKDYYYGENGVEEDWEKAAELITKAAEQGLAEAQYYLGYFNMEDKVLLECDPAKGIYWYTKAAEQGYVDAQFNLAMHYLDGDGVEKDLKTAIKWLATAAEKGCRKSQCTLGERYEKGEGVEKDIKKAVSLYYSAAIQGDAIAKSNLLAMKKEGIDSADSALEEIKKEAGSSGLAIFLKQHLPACIGPVRQRQLKFGETVVEDQDWDLDLQNATITFSEDQYRIQILGTESYVTDTWLWSFASSKANDWPDDIVKAAKEAYKIILEATGDNSTKFDLTDFVNGHNIATLLIDICKQNDVENVCYYRCPYENGAAFVLVYDIPKSVFAPVDALQSVKIITDIISYLELDAKTLVRSMVETNCASFAETENGITGQFAGGIELAVLFDGLGRIESMKTNNAASSLRENPAPAEKPIPGGQKLFDETYLRERNPQKATQSQIDEFCERTGAKLPEDYRHFLLEYNGVVFNSGVCLHIPELDKTVELDYLRGFDYYYDLAKDYAYNRNYKLDNSTFVIGECNTMREDDDGDISQHGRLCVMILNDEHEEPGIYVCDLHHDDFFLEESTEDNNLFKVADSFSDFVAKLKYPEKPNADIQQNTAPPKQSLLLSLDTDTITEKSEIYGLSAYNESIPLAYKILVSQDAKLSPSAYLNTDEPIAIVGDFDKGRKKLFNFLYELQQSGFFNQAGLQGELERQIQKAREFLFDESHTNKYAVLEAGMIFHMWGKGWVEQAKNLFTEVTQIDAIINQHMMMFQAQVQAYLSFGDSVDEQTKQKYLQDRLWAVLGIDCWEKFVPRPPDASPAAAKLLELAHILTNGNQKVIAELESLANNSEPATFAYWMTGYNLLDDELSDFAESNCFGAYIDWKEEGEEIVFGLQIAEKNLNYSLGLEKIEFPDDECGEDALSVISKNLSAKGFALLYLDIDGDCYHLFVIPKKDEERLMELAADVGFDFRLL